MVANGFSKPKGTRGNVDQFKAIIVVKGLLNMKGLILTVLLPVLSQDPFKIIMAIPSDGF